jgi:hypothetical protein
MALAYHGRNAMKAKEQLSSGPPKPQPISCAGEAPMVDPSPALTRPGARASGFADDRSVTARRQKVKELI